MTLQTDPSPHCSTDAAQAEDPQTEDPQAEDTHPQPADPQSPARPDGWTAICPLDRLPVERGVAALVAGEPVAVFRTHDDRLFALHNVDPFTGASVLSRGIVGDRNGTPIVASPLHKQHFVLESGTTMEDDSVSVASYPVRVVAGAVEVCQPHTPPRRNLSTDIGTAPPTSCRDRDAGDDPNPTRSSGPSA